MLESPPINATRRERYKMPTSQAKQNTAAFLQSLGLKPAAKPKAKPAAKPKAAGSTKEDLQKVLNRWKANNESWSAVDTMLTNPTARAELLEALTNPEHVWDKVDLVLTKSYAYKSPRAKQPEPAIHGNWYVNMRMVTFRIAFICIPETGEITSANALMNYKHPASKDENKAIILPFIRRVFGETVKNFCNTNTNNEEQK